MSKMPEAWAKYAEEKAQRKAELAKNLQDERQAVDEVCRLLDRPNPDLPLIKAVMERFSQASAKVKLELERYVNAAEDKAGGKL